MNAKKLGMLVLGMVAFSASARDAGVYLTPEFKATNFQVRSATNGVDETLFQNREKYGIKGFASFDVNKGRGTSEKFQCKFGRKYLPLDGPEVNMPTCKLNKKVVFDKYNFDELFATAQLLKVEERKSNDKDVFCERHVVRLTYKIVPENLTQKPLNFGKSEIEIYASDGCVQLPDYDYYKHTQTKTVTVVN